MREAETEKVEGDKIEHNHMTSTFSTAVTARPAGEKSDSYGINSIEALQHLHKCEICAHDNICTRWFFKCNLKIHIKEIKEQLMSVSLSFHIHFTLLIAKILPNGATSV